MGTDIHGGFIRDKGDNGLNGMALRTNWEMNRDYTLFAILAGVRNGYGFAGCYRHEPLKPIAEGRGKPDFLTFNDEGKTEDLYNPWFGSEYACDDETMYGCWLGEHSFTYMTIPEILKWEGWSKKLTRGGVVSKDHYNETLLQGLNPEAWSGGVGGGGVLVVSEDEYAAKRVIGNTEDVTHIQATWKDDVTLGEEYEWFLDEVKRLKDTYSTCGGSDIYLVIGFDS